MKPAREIIAELRRVRLYDYCCEIAAREHATIDQVCSSSRTQEMARARLAVWARLAEFLGSQSHVARIWGVDHSSVAYAVDRASPELVKVVLATFETDSAKLELAWVRRQGGQFGVADRVRDKLCWFDSYDLAREVYSRCCEEAGSPTFRSVSAAGGAS